MELSLLKSQSVIHYDLAKDLNNSIFIIFNYTFYCTFNDQITFLFFFNDNLFLN